MRWGALPCTEQEWQVLMWLPGPGSSNPLPSLELERSYILQSHLVPINYHCVFINLPLPISCEAPESGFSGLPSWCRRSRARWCQACGGRFINVYLMNDGMDVSELRGSSCLTERGRDETQREGTKKVKKEKETGNRAVVVTGERELLYSFRQGPRARLRLHPPIANLMLFN